MIALTTPGAVRTAIREKVRTLLLDKTPAGKSVFVSRSLPDDPESLPAIGIYTTGESADKFNEAPKSYRRDVSLMIEVKVIGDTDEQVDALREEFADVIEAEMEKDETLGDLASSLTLVANEFTEDTSGDSAFGRLAVLYTVRYYLEASPPATDIDDLNTVNIDYRIKRPEQTPTSKDASDRIELNQEGS